MSNIEEKNKSDSYPTANNNNNYENVNAYIASLDIGTTSVRCFIYDKKVETVGLACENVSITTIAIVVTLMEKLHCVK